MEMFIDNEQAAKIKVIGVGGGGGNAVQNMIESGLEGVSFIRVFRMKGDRLKTNPGLGNPDIIEKITDGGLANGVFLRGICLDDVQHV